MDFMDIENDLMLELYRKLFLCRRFEEKVYQLILDGVVLGSVHLSTGEEAAAVGTIGALEKTDYILPTHRGHCQHLSKGAEPDKLMAELAGKETGYCKGNSGSIHIFDRENNNLGSNGIVGAQFPITVGAGMAIKYKKLNSCVVCFTGDGATNQGWFYELLNLMSLWQLPVIIVCVNNLYGMGTPYSETSLASVNEKPRLFKIRSEVVDGNDVEAVYIIMKELVELAKKESKPALLECLTYRWMGHSAFDQRPYRPKEEIEKWKNLDPIKRAETKLISRGIKSSIIDDIKKRVNNQIEEAANFAINSKFPEFNVSMQM